MREQISENPLSIVWPVPCELSVFHEAPLIFCRPRICQMHSSCLELFETHFRAMPNTSKQQSVEIMRIFNKKLQKVYNFYFLNSILSLNAKSPSPFPNCRSYPLCFVDQRHSTALQPNTCRPKHSHRRQIQRSTFHQSFYTHKKKKPILYPTSYSEK